MVTAEEVLSVHWRPRFPSNSSVRALLSVIRRRARISSKRNFDLVPKTCRGASQSNLQQQYIPWTLCSDAYQKPICILLLWLPSLWRQDMLEDAILFRHWIWQALGANQFCRWNVCLIYVCLFHSTSPRSGRVIGCECAPYVCLHTCGSGLIFLTGELD